MNYKKGDKVRVLTEDTALKIINRKRVEEAEILKVEGFLNKKYIVINKQGFASEITSKEIIDKAQSNEKSS